MHSRRAKHLAKENSHRACNFAEIPNFRLYQHDGASAIAALTMISPRTIGQAVENAAKMPPQVGIHFVPESGVPGFNGSGDAPVPFFSYADIERISARYAGALQAMGLRKGDRIALILPNNDDFLFAFFGAARAGIVPVPIYPPLGLGQLQTYLDNTRHIVAKSGARILLTSQKVKLLLGSVQANASKLEQVVTIESIRNSNDPFRQDTVTLDDVAFLQFTSGSTSRPKGVTLTHAQLAANIHCIMKYGIRGTKEDVGVTWLPLYHDMGLIGMIFSPLYWEIPIVNMSPLLFLKRPVTWLHAVTRYAGTISWAPNFAFALCQKRIKPEDLQGVDLSSWRIAGCGAEPIRKETLSGFARAFKSVGFKETALMPSYGMAESSLAISFSELDEGLKSITVRSSKLWGEGVAQLATNDDTDSIEVVSCGSRFPEHDIAIFGLDDTASIKPLGEDKVGEIRICGPSLMRGYWDDSEKTTEVFAGKYLRTGDLGFLHENRLYICGRSKEVIIINGRNFYPQDIEWEASKVEGIRKGNVIAFGARDMTGKDLDRERIVVAAEVQDAARLADRETIALNVRKSVQEGLGVVVDDVVVLVAGTLPKTSSGKLQRAKTRELYELDELTERKSARQESKLELVKNVAKSQLDYFKLSIFGNRKKD